MRADFRMIPHESTLYSMSSEHTHLGVSRSKGVSAGVTLRQGVQQRLGLLEVGGVKALGEPAVDRRQQRARFVPLALLLPQAAEAHSSAQLQGFGLLAVGDVESPLEAGFCLRLWRPWLPQEQDALEA